MLASINVLTNVHFRAGRAKICKDPVPLDCGDLNCSIRPVVDEVLHSLLDLLQLFSDFTLHFS